MIPPKTSLGWTVPVSQPLLYMRATSDLSSSFCSSMFISSFYWRPQNWSLSFCFSPLSLNTTLALVFLSPTPFLDSISLFLTGHLSLLLPLSFFFSMFEFYQEFILTDLAPPLISCMSGWIIFNRFLNQVFWTLLFSRAVAQRIFLKQVSEQAKLCLLEAQGFKPAFCSCSFPSGSWGLPSYSHCRQEGSSCCTYLMDSSLVLGLGSSREPPFISSSTKRARKLAPVLQEHPGLAAPCWAALQQTPGWSSLPCGPELQS